MNKPIHRFTTAQEPSAAPQAQSIGAMVMSTEKGVEAVERALSLLDAIPRSGKASLSLHELSLATGFYKSTILRLTVSLERYGYLRRRDDGRFELGPACSRLAQARGATLDQSQLLQGSIRDLARRSGETASFYVRDGHERVCLFRENSTQSIRHHVDVGARLPLDKGAAGLVLLAWGGESGERFERIRAEGLALSLGDRDPDAAAISAPLFDASDSLLGALTISGLRSRFTAEAIQGFRDLLRQEVAHLEQEFGRRSLT